MADFRLSLFLHSFWFSGKIRPQNRIWNPESTSNAHIFYMYGIRNLWFKQMNSAGRESGIFG